MLSKFFKSSLPATFLMFTLFSAFETTAQNESGEVNSIHGNFQIDAQYYKPDSLIGAPQVPEKMLSNAWGNINYIKGKFSAGIRYEAYNNVMQGFDQRYKGEGITNRFARYQTELLDITIGHIYEQFGSGLLLRTYYEPGLLYDNALDGIRVISNPVKGITLKALAGKQRTFFTLGPGIVRGFDSEININELFDSVLGSSKTRLIIGGSFVSKYQADQNPDLHLPQNVGAYGGRINLVREGFSFFGEYVVKENDPSADNSSVFGGNTYYSYKKGDAIFLSGSYATKGLSFMIQAKRIDNMGFRSDRDASLQNLLINYLPATTRQHTYLMPAFNPYATQPRGEVGGMAEIQYMVKKGTWLGGKYGADITLNYSVANGLKEIGVDDTTTSLKLYKTKYGDIGQIYYQDIFIEITKKFTPKWKTNFLFAQQFYNRNMVQFGSRNAGYDNIRAFIGVADITFKYQSNSAIRLESQVFVSDNKSNPNAGSWTTNMLEWSPGTHFFIALLDQYNYSNPDEDRITAVKRENVLNDVLTSAGFTKLAGALNLHYFLLSAGYTSGAHRISLSLGKQRQGIFCVGGVCRVVPASNGVALSITSSF